MNNRPLFIPVVLGIKDRDGHDKRIDKFLGELIRMSKVLRYGRENVSI